jgi:hypothetical protein
MQRRFIPIRTPFDSIAPPNHGIVGRAFKSSLAPGPRFGSLVREVPRKGLIFSADHDTTYLPAVGEHVADLWHITVDGKHHRRRDPYLGEAGGISGVHGKVFGEGLFEHSTRPGYEIDLLLYAELGGKVAFG